RGPLGGHAAIEDRDHARARHAARRHGLVVEPAYERLVRGEPWMQDLDRHGARQRGLIGQEHQAHPAFSDALAQDVLAGQDLTWPREAVGRKPRPVLRRATALDRLAVDGSHTPRYSKGRTSVCG